MELPTGVPRACLAALLLSAWALPPASAQRVRGTVRDSISGVGVPGAVVSVLDSAGASRARTIANEDGGFSIVRPAGAQRLRVIRIGFLPREIPLPRGNDSLRIAMAQLPALLARVRVSDQSVCGGSDHRTDALALWEQARAGLLATVVARETRPGRMRIVSFVTDRDPDSDIVTSQTLRTDSGLTSRPFVATAPASAFARHGYMERDADDGLTFFAPDADVLLDPGFAAAHCFGVTSDESGHPGQIGLAFEPARPRDGFVDVQGTLWIDRAAPQLRTLDFTYTGLQRWYLEAHTGGTLEFHAMPNGVAFITRWVLHLQSFAEARRRPGGSDGQLGGIGRWRSDGTTDVRMTSRRDAGAEVLSAAWSDGARMDDRLGTVAGVVRPAGGGAPLAGVVVHVSGTARSTTSDSTGRFRIEDLIPGRYRLTAYDPLLAPYSGDDSTARVVDVGRDTTRLDTVQVPSRAAALDALCRAQHANAPTPRTAVLLARAVDTDGAPIRDLELHADWLANVIVGPAGIAGGVRAARAIRPRDDGRFALCGVPRDRGLVLSAWRGSTRLADTTLHLGAAELPTFDWRIAGRAPVRDASMATFVGSVFADSGATPLAGAEVGIPSLGRAATAASDGRFMLAGVPPGRWPVRVRRIGFTLLTDTIVAEADHVVHRLYELGAATVQLDTVTTRGVARSLSPLLRGFEDRRRTGLGHYVGTAELRAHDGEPLARVMFGRMPGILWVPYGSHLFAESTRSAASTFADSPLAIPIDVKSPRGCWLTTYLDGIRIYNPNDGEDAPDFNTIEVSQLAGVEYYAGAATVPPQFNATAGMACGTLLLWTRE